MMPTAVDELKATLKTIREDIFKSDNFGEVNDLEIEADRIENEINELTGKKEVGL